MKILFFNYEYPPLGGGAGNATFYILREFSRIPELEVDLVTSSADNNFHREKIGEKITVYKLPIGKGGKNLHFQTKKDIVVYCWKAYFFARKLARKNKYDLSHSFFTVPCGFLSFLFKRRRKLPYIVSLRGADVPGYSERFSLIYKFIKPLVRIIWKNASAVVANSQGLKELALKTKPNQKIEVIFNGVDTEYFKPAFRSLAPEEKEFIITPGASRVTARKGIKYLIKAVDKLLPKYPNILLKIIGEGSEKKNLEQLAENLGIKNKVAFLGRISHNETLKYYREADVFVLPSFNEGMSNAMLEALSCGLPIIATHTGGTEELVREGVNGFVVKEKNSRDLADKIKKIASDEDLRQKMAQESRNLAMEFSWKNVAQKYFKIYKEILNQNEK
jgi:L-malate glycosyltransferase